MHVAFVVNNYPPKSGGVETHVSSLARELALQGHKVTVFTLSDRDEVSSEQGIEVIRYPEFAKVGGVLGFPLPGTKRKMMRAMRGRRPDLLSVHTRFFPMSVLGWRIGKRLGIPVLHTEHGSDYVTTSSSAVRLASRVVDHTLGRQVLRGADRVVGVSEEVTAFVWRLAGVRADVFYNAIDLLPAVPVEKRPEKLVFVGRITSGKGWDVFVELVETMHARGIPVHAEILGDGPESALLEQTVLQSSATEVIRVRGRVTPQQVREALAGATLVNPTVLSEGFQTTLLEALSSGARIVTYPVPGAQLLVEQDAPVTITHSRTAQALVDAVITGVHEPWQAFSEERLQEWGWARRASEYVGIADALVRQKENPDLGLPARLGDGTSERCEGQE